MAQHNIYILYTFPSVQRDFKLRIENISPLNIKHLQRSPTIKTYRKLLYLYCVRYKYGAHFP
jgi:hypothetical protein